MSEPLSISTGIASRYASADFRPVPGKTGALATLEADVDALDAALTASADLRAMIASPLYSREDQGAAIGGRRREDGPVARLIGNLLALMASKRRLFVLPQLVADAARA